MKCAICRTTVSAVQSGTGEFRRVQDDTEGKQIGSTVEFFAPDLFRRDVSDVDTPVASAAASIAAGWGDPRYANLISANLAKGYV